MQTKTFSKLSEVNWPEEDYMTPKRASAMAGSDYDKDKTLSPRAGSREIPKRTSSVLEAQSTDTGKA